MPNELMPEKLDGYRPATIEEELALTKSGADLGASMNRLFLVDAKLKLLEAEKVNLMRDLDDARKAIAAAQSRSNATLDNLGLPLGDDKALKEVKGVLYIREAKAAAKKE